MADISQKTVAAQHKLIANHASLEGIFPNAHPDAQWFLDGGNLGMFIHWGIGSADGNLDLSWPMIAGKPWDRRGYKHTVTGDYYFGLAEKFAPNGCNFDKMIQAAAECGHTYAVLTTRHHEGFALWPSDYGDFNTKNYHGGADFVRMFVDACRKYDIKAGLYYSPPDWYHNRNYMSFYYGGENPNFPDRPYFDFHHHPIEKLPEKPEGWELREAEYVSGQIRELLKRYGKIDILWFDGSIPMYDKAITMDEIRQLQPSIVMTSRMNRRGDFQVFERSLPERKPDLPWEHCTTWTEFCWGYCEQCLHTYRTAQWAVDLYDKVCFWGGNLLLNVAPDNFCELPEISYKTYADMKELLVKRNKKVNYIGK